MSTRTFLTCLLIVTLRLSTAEVFGQDDRPEPATSEYERGVIIEVQGVILPRLEKYLDRRLEQARKRGADLVILEIDSPGGAVETTLSIADQLRGIDWARTVAFIPREALSGAAIMSLACDEIVMAPAARLGDAGPIVIGPDALFRHAPEKLRSHLVRHVRDLAEATQRPPALAEAMVDMDLVVYRVTNRETGVITYMSQAEIDSSENPAIWELGPPVLESDEGSFLEVNGTRAVELQLANGLAEDREQLAGRYDVAEMPLLILRRTALDTTVDILNHPLVTGLLLVVGAVALFVELSAPGIGVGGLLSGLCFVVFFWSRFLGGTAGWLEVILVLAGVVFLAVELFVIPGFGIAGLSGLGLIAAGILLASQEHLLPNSPRAMSQLGTSLVVLVASGAVSLVGLIALSRVYGSIPILNRLVLQAPSREDQQVEATDKPLPAAPTTQVAVGDWGVADSPLRPAGKVIIGDQYVDVVTDGSFVERGHQVRVIQVRGNQVVVREVDPQ